MSQPSRPSLPRTLIVAYQRLCKILDVAIGDYEAHQRFSDADEICHAIGRFVKELYRVPKWRAELERRAGLVKRLTAPGADYAQAQAESLANYQEQPTDRCRARVAHELRIAEANPSLLWDIIRLGKLIKRVFDQRILDLSPPAESAFRQWQQKCVDIELDTAADEPDGCHFLHHIFLALDRDASERSEVIRGVIETESLDGPWLEPMRIAAESLVEWVAENPAGGPTADAEAEAKQVQEVGDEGEATKSRDEEHEDGLFPGFLFARSGDGYEISGSGVRGHFKRTVGFEHIEKLLRNAGKPVLMSELAGDGQDDRIDADNHSQQEVFDEETKKIIRFPNSKSLRNRSLSQSRRPL